METAWKEKRSQRPLISTSEKVPTTWIRLALIYHTKPMLPSLAWDTSFGDEDNRGFCSDFDLVYSGSPEATVSISGTYAATATVSGDVQKEINDLQESLDDFEW